MDSEHGSGRLTLSRITEADIVNLDNSFEPSTAVDFEQSGGTRTSSETTASEVAVSTADFSKSSNFLPSSSSENSSEDFFQVNPTMIPVHDTSGHDSLPNSEGNANSPPKDGKNDDLSEPLFQLEEMFGSSRSASQDSDVTHESVISILSPRQSPPIQVMERPRGYDPDRIPASVFAKPTSPVDWSVASTESLFSIQIGNISFSRDHAFKLVEDTNKPNEIGKSGELYISKEFYQPSPVTKEERKALDVDLPNRRIRDQGGKNLKANIQSFANPVKKKSSKSSFASCSNCSCKCPSCCFKCPSCSSCCCKWPSCSCQWAGCFSCKWPSCLICCCKWPCCSCKSLSCPSCSWKWSWFPSFSWKRSCFPSCCGKCKSGCCKSLSWPSCSSCSCKWSSWFSCCSKG